MASLLHPGCLVCRRGRNLSLNAEWKNHMKLIPVAAKFIAFLFVPLLCAPSLFAQPGNPEDGRKEREYLVKTLTRIADPLLTTLSKNELRKQMPVEAAPGVTDRPSVTHLEAFGRLLAGIAPWLELGPENSAEGKLRKKYNDLALLCIKNAVDPSSPDFLNFSKGSQPLVDAAFFAEGLLRAPGQLWKPLDEQTKQNVIKALQSSRVIKPGNNNWVLFSSTVEAALLTYQGTYEKAKVDTAVLRLMSWYKGDGTYGDGAEYHWDYYNSFVMHPMLLETLDALVKHDPQSPYAHLYPQELQRAQRYAAVQERMISPEGTYPPVGRSLAYRFGAFHLLSKVALMHALPHEVEPQQVRAALYTMIKRQSEAPGTFDKNGWLQIGLYGHQPSIGENYISTGSLYLCSEAFLILGLPASDPLWQGKDLPWTTRKIWMGTDIPTDHAIQH